MNVPISEEVFLNCDLQSPFNKAVLSSMRHKCFATLMV